MTIVNALIDYTNNDNDIIKDTATKIQGYAELYNSGEISTDEYNDLCNDILNLQHISDDARNLERMIAIREAFDAMRSLVSSFK